jgi:hypothetical protein
VHPRHPSDTLSPCILRIIEALPVDLRRTHSFGFLRNEADIPGRRRAGSQSWAGVLNTHYWFDRHRGPGRITTPTLPLWSHRQGRLREF